MTKILIATEKPFSKKAVAKIKGAVKEGYNLELLEKYTEKSQLLAAMEYAEALVVRSDKVDAEVIKAGKQLKVVVRAGVGYDNIDLQAASDAGVVVMNTPGQNANAVAELVLGMLLYSLRSRFNGASGQELKGKILGVHGYGNIGAAILEITKGFQMTPKTIKKANRPVNSGIMMTDSVVDLYKTCHIISLHLPLTSETKGCINKVLFDLMKDDAILVNTARKEIINEDDLMEAMRQKKEIRFLSDIRPDKAEEMEAEFGERVFFTPKKMGAQTEEANINAGVASINQIMEYLEKGESPFILNK